MTRIRILDFPVRRGKAATLKALVAAVAAEPDPPDVLVFSDANTLFEPEAMERLLAPFADPRVGGVCGRLILTDPAGRAQAETGYWAWENRLKERESRLDSCLGANGAIYAVRRELFWRALPDNAIVDDFVIGMKVRAAGWRMLYEPAAVAREPAPAPDSEWARRVRIGMGDWQALGLCAECLRPRHGLWAGMFLSHKVLRWLTPHAGLLLLIGAGGLYADWLGREPRSAFDPALWLAAGIVGAVGAGLVCAVLSARPTASRFVRKIGHFTRMQMALFVGFLRFVFGSRKRLRGSWARTPREGEGEGKSEIRNTQARRKSE